MNNVTTSTIGIDTVIQSIQTTLYEQLTSEWCDNIDAYGRVYRNVHRTDANPNTIVPEWYIGNNEYKDVYYSDEFACVYTFIDDQNHTTNDEMVFSSNVKCVFMVDLSRIYLTEVGRADMKAQNDVIEVLRNNAFNRFTVTGITKGIRNVFQGFEQDGIKFTDTHPYHCFSIDIELFYYLTDKCV